MKKGEGDKSGLIKFRCYAKAEIKELKESKFFFPRSKQLVKGTYTEAV